MLKKPLHCLFVSASPDVVLPLSPRSASDVAGFVSKLLKKPSTFVSYGSLAALPRHDAFAKRLA